MRSVAEKSSQLISALGSTRLDREAMFVCGVPMDPIDRELIDAVYDGANAGPVGTPERPIRDKRPKSSKRQLGLLAGLVIAAIAVGLLVFRSFNNAIVYAKTVDQLLAASQKFIGRPVRVEGFLVHGSLVRRDHPCEHRFKLAKNGSVLEVRYPQCIIPDTFRDVPETDVGVTAEGKLTRDGVFEASQIMAKCPSKYEERNGKRVPVGT